MADDPTAELLFDETWEDAGGHFRHTLTADRRGVTRHHGKGSMAGVRAWIDMLEASKVHVSRDAPVTAMVDLSELHGSPIRAQVLLGVGRLDHAASSSHEALRLARALGTPEDELLVQSLLVRVALAQGLFDHAAFQLQRVDPVLDAALLRGSLHQRLEGVAQQRAAEFQARALHHGANASAWRPAAACRPRNFLLSPRGSGRGHLVR